ncbi:hypothetical protein SUNI508_03836 [Seiridium unicorne]|uniref:Carrier domain-containing protein n=1 Tax=Seiridium unicorne TaxID=138068 RepID=A0ABR2VA83_9PEZI
MDPGGLNYFTCTLGQCALWKQQQPKNTRKSFDTVLELIDEQAREYPDSAALGFADFHADDNQHRPSFVTFRELRKLSQAAAKILAQDLRLEDCSSTTSIGLLCKSSFDFVLTWLGLMRLGNIVFLLAPQLEAAAIKHLCVDSDVRTIFLGKDQEHKSPQEIEGLSFRCIPDYWHTDIDSITGTPLSALISDIAYLRHTSGTSSGLPKPIVQKHWGAVGVLPCLTNNRDVATFTTTPLYHGGLADCFRAWTSGAMIWFFPEGVVPVTETNVTKAVQFARERSPDVVRVAYFTSVPYVLQSLAGNPEGLQLLQTMELVGVGGAALAPSVGDQLVDEGVKLVSRMGSAECGFLMSSHRDYATDKEWQYLRPVIDGSLISFEPRDDGLFELVAKPGWPLRARQNREDGSYATSDLFQPHDQIPNAWRYNSRSDAQITLANGKKFDPAPLEGAVVASTKQLEDIFVFGTGRDFAGALLFPASQDLSESEVLEAAWPVIERVNRESQSHARLARTALMVVPKLGGGSSLEKSSKGTIMRRQAEEKYADLIEAAYSLRKGGQSTFSALDDDELCAVIAEKFSDVLGRDVSPSEDLFRQGVDSIACIQIRKLIEACLLPPGSGPLALNAIYEHGTIQNLSLYIKGLRQGKEGTQAQENGHTDDSDLSLMVELVRTHGNFTSASISPTKTKEQRHTVILTGATGALGAHVLGCLRKDSGVHKIYCLVRARTPPDAHERVAKGLCRRGMRRLDESSSYPNFDNKVVCLPCDLFDKNLGLPDEVRRRISQESTLIIHAAWAVNFSLRLNSFEDQLQGLHHLLRFSLSSGSQFSFISSTASVSASPAANIAESCSSNPLDASPLGYSRSKWVAEQICAAADQHCIKARRGKETPEHPRVSVIRIGQLCGNRAGIWNASEAYPLMLSTAKITGCLPDLQDSSLSWLPVDQAAQAVLEIASKFGKSEQELLDLDTTDPMNSPTLPVYHVLNPHKLPKWRDMLQWLQDSDHMATFEVVTPSSWMDRLEEALGGKAAGHDSQKLLGFWQHVYGGQSRYDSGNDQVSRKPAVFEISCASHVSKTMAEVQPLDRDQVLQMWKWICENVGKGTEA